MFISYIKIILYLLLASIIATIAIWAGIFMIIFTAIAAPFIAWWMRRDYLKKIKVMKPKQTKPEQPGYNIIEAEFKIIDK